MLVNSEKPVLLSHNAPSLGPEITKQQMNDVRYEVRRDPPYSLDLAPIGFLVSLDMGLRF